MLQHSGGMYDDPFRIVSVQHVHHTRSCLRSYALCWFWRASGGAVDSLRTPANYGPKLRQITNYARLRAGLPRFVAMQMPVEYCQGHERHEGVTHHLQGKKQACAPAKQNAGSRCHRLGDRHQSTGTAACGHRLVFYSLVGSFAGRMLLVSVSTEPFCTPQMYGSF